MSKSLSDSLSKFMSSEQLTVPSDDENTDELRIQSFEEFMEKDKENRDKRKSEKKKSKKKDESFEDMIKQGNAMIDDILDDYLVDDFDGYLDGYMLDDEDAELRQNLLRYGRKYTRDTKTSAESSEISKAYSETEKLLSDLLKEIESDKELVQKDITNMRMMRTRNYKTLADLIESKSQFHNTALSVIKEINSMKKNQFELQMKVDKSKKEDEADDSTANKAIQQLFGVGRGNLLGGGESGGYASISGSEEAGTYSDDDSYGYDEDEMIQKKYFSNDDYEETDGDKFLKYEGMGVHYILLYDDDNHKEIIAEDRDGNLVPDYPLPSNPDNLDFEISESTGTATDNLSNQYELRKM